MMFMLAQKKIVRTAARKKFQRYKPEVPKTVRTPDVKENETVRKMKRLFKELMEYNIWKEDARFSTELLSIPAISDIEYRYIFPRIRFPYTSSDVTMFCLAIAEFMDIEEVDRAGVFLSALINKGKDREYKLHVSHLEGLVFDLGFKNSSPRPFS